MAQAPLFLPKKKNSANLSTWHGKAFIMEALVLLLFLVISMTVLIQLFGSSQSHDKDAVALTHAVILASNEAERFNVEPSSDVVEHYAVTDGVLKLSEKANENAFTVTRAVSPLPQENGTLYQATITIEQHGQVVYELESATYTKLREESR